MASRRAVAAAVRRDNREPTWIRTGDGPESKWVSVDAHLNASMDACYRDVIEPLLLRWMLLPIEEATS